MSEISEQVDQLVTSVGGPRPATPAKVFIPGNYPYIYGLDYLRRQMGEDVGRSEAAAMVTRFAQAKGLTEKHLIIALAERYLIQEGLEVSHEERLDAMFQQAICDGLETK